MPYWKAFHDLSDQRSSGMSVGAIRLEAIECWFRLHWIDNPVEQHRYLHHLRELDRAYLEFHHKRSEAEMKKTSKLPGGHMGSRTQTSAQIRAGAAR